MKLVVFRSYVSGQGMSSCRRFRNYIYKKRGLPIELRQHLLQELVRLRDGEITDIRITLEGSDARFKEQVI